MDVFDNSAWGLWGTFFSCMLRSTLLPERRSVRDVDVGRGSPRHQSGSSRDVKSLKRPPLPAWLGDKPEDANEWYYTDPKVGTVISPLSTLELEPVLHAAPMFQGCDRALAAAACGQTLIELPVAFALRKCCAHALHHVLQSLDW